MTKLRALIFTAILALAYSSNDDLFAYYLNLINAEFKRIETITPPTDAFKDKPDTSTRTEYGTFDHIVIGAGSAGAIVASRLAEDPKRQVLLLEAGGEETNFTYIPGMAIPTLSLEYDWNYFSVPQTTSCLGNFERRCPYPRGKLLGGSSAVNGMIYTRGSKHDYNKWCELGNPGWCYEDVLPFFKKSETSHVTGDSSCHGDQGPVHVEWSEPITNQQRAFIEAHKELKRSYIDYNGVRQEGVGRTQMNTCNGQRSSTARAFLQPTPSSNRSNIKISTHSHVTKILINSTSKKAIGVVFAKSNQYYVAMSRKDIVLSAGTIGSPQILMLSGIGPRHHLKSLGIPIVEDLAVGENFQDHVAFGILHFKNNFPVWGKSMEDDVRDYVNGHGKFTDAFNAKGIAFVRTNLTALDDYSDIEIVHMGSNSTSAALQKVFGYSDETFKLAWPHLNESYFFTIMVILLHPESRGYIKLKSSDAFEYPLINTRSLSDSEGRDIERIYQGIQLTLELLETKAFKDLGARLHKVHLPACEEHEYMSKDYWYCHIRQVGTSIAHMVGTCTMGPDPRRGAVVDHTLRVHGIQNLRVADASIMPLVPGGHTNAASMMVGEKAAHMILSDQ